MMAPAGPPDPIEVAASIARIFERLGIRYLIGGSLASSVHGEPRSTNDVDVLADFRLEHVEPFATALGGDYYISTEAVHEAVAAGDPFNVIHMDAAVKVDVFPAAHDAFDQERLRQRERVLLPSRSGASVYVDTAAHSVLRKLEWFRRGGEVSERQWRDSIAILRIQGSRLDRAVMADWAAHLGVEDLLARAWIEAESERE